MRLGESPQLAAETGGLGFATPRHARGSVPRPRLAAASFTPRPPWESGPTRPLGRSVRLEFPGKPREHDATGPGPAPGTPLRAPGSRGRRAAAESHPDAEASRPGCACVQQGRPPRGTGQRLLTAGWSPSSLQESLRTPRGISDTPEVLALFPFLSLTSAGPSDGRGGPAGRRPSGARPTHRP